MKKIFLALTISAFVATAAFAGDGGPKAKKEKKAKCTKEACCKKTATTSATTTTAAPASCAGKEGAKCCSKGAKATEGTKETK